MVTVRKFMVIFFIAGNTQVKQVLGKCLLSGYFTCMIDRAQLQVRNESVGGAFVTYVAKVSCTLYTV